MLSMFSLVIYMCWGIVCVIKAPPPDFPAAEPIEDPIPEPDREPLAETAPPQETKQPIEEDIIIPEEIEKAETVKAKLIIILFNRDNGNCTVYFNSCHIPLFSF